MYSRTPHIRTRFAHSRLSFSPLPLHKQPRDSALKHLYSGLAPNHRCIVNI